MKELEMWASTLEQEDPMVILQWGVEKFGNRLALACSFGAEDVALVDMIVKIEPKAKIFYLDTDLHFAETYETRDRLQERYGMKFIQVRPQLSLAEQAAKYGSKLWESNPDLCCHIRKVAPLAGFLEDYDAWITGIRRDQSPVRANARKVEWDPKFSLVKMNPLASWTTDDVWDYIHANEVPYNPLHDKNYPSIGCSPCTSPVEPGADPRAGRWAGHLKTECGLHK